MPRTREIVRPHREVRYLGLAISAVISAGTTPLNKLFEPLHQLSVPGEEVDGVAAPHEQAEVRDELLHVLPVGAGGERR